MAIDGVVLAARRKREAPEPRGVLSGPVAVGLRPIENSLNAPSEARGGFKLLFPERSEDPLYVDSADIRHRRGADLGGGIGAQRATPMQAMLRVAPHPFMFVYELLGGFIECQPTRFLKASASPLSVPGRNGIDTSPHCAASLGGHLAGCREAHGRIASQT